jgi:hypothetical protein
MRNTALDFSIVGAHPRRPLSGRFSCYRDRASHVLTTTCAMKLKTDSQSHTVHSQEKTLSNPLTFAPPSQARRKPPCA